jgi:hypothetical protein
MFGAEDERELPLRTLGEETGETGAGAGCAVAAGATLAVV